MVCHLQMLVLSHCFVRLFVTPWTVAHQAPLSMGILQARILEWVAMPSSSGSSRPKDGTQVSYIAGGFFTVWATREAQVIERRSQATTHSTWASGRGAPRSGTFQPMRVHLILQEFCEPVVKCSHYLKTTLLYDWLMWENLGFQTQLGTRDQTASGICCFLFIEPPHGSWRLQAHMLPS